MVNGCKIKILWPMPVRLPEKIPFLHQNVQDFSTKKKSYFAAHGGFEILFTYERCMERASSDFY